jgi:hypothetical protein
VTAVDHQKLTDAKDLKKQATHYFHEDSYIILNKCTEKQWEEHEVLGKLGLELKASILKREKMLKDSVKNEFNQVLEFGEVLHLSPLTQIQTLLQQWKTT